MTVSKTWSLKNRCDHSSDGVDWVVIIRLRNGAGRPDEGVDDLVALQYAMPSNRVDVEQ